MKLLPFAAAAIAAGLASPAAAATLVNGGFEANLSGWAVAGSGTVAAVAEAQDFSGTPYLPTEGVAFALLTPGGPDDTTLSQSFSVTGASVLSFDWAFLAMDDFDHNDTGFIQVLDGRQNQIALFQVAVDDLSQFGSTGWLHQTVNLAVGDYTFVAGVRDVGDDPSAPFEAGFDSQVLVDNVALASGAVPEPAAWGLMILGFAGLGATLRARRSAPLSA